LSWETRDPVDTSKESIDKYLAKFRYAKDFSFS